MSYEITVGSLFAGVGGIDLGLEWAGLGPVAWQVERDEWRRGVLARHWPDVPRFDDVRTVGGGTLERVDLVAGGFPCRGTSSAGKRTGLDHPESGLWYEFLRVVVELEPVAVLVENPASGRRRWLAEAKRGLAAAGYATRDVGVSAREVGSPQFRPRTILLARREGVADGARPGREGGERLRGDAKRGEPPASDRGRVPDGDGIPVREQPRRGWWADGEGEAVARAARDLRRYWMHVLGDGGDRGVPDGEGVGRDSRPSWGRGGSAGRTVACRDDRPRVPDGYSDGRLPGTDEDAVGWLEAGRDAERRPGDDYARTDALEPGLGRDVHELSAGLDGGRPGPRWRWPARRGLPPAPGEPPKVRPAVRGDDRRRRVAALGDSCVPACAFVAGLALIDWLAEDR